MPLCTLHLVQLHHQGQSDSAFAARRRFLHRILSSTTSDLSERLLVACVVRRPVIVATRIDHVHLNKTPWDLVLVFAGAPSGTAATSSSQSLSLASHPITRSDVAAEYVVAVGIPSRIMNSYADRTRQLNKEASETERLSVEDLQQSPARTVARYQPKTSQNLEMSPALVELVEELQQLGTQDGLADGRGPVQQLNLLSFKTDKADKDRYYEYGKGFGQAAAKFGGEPKIMASVVKAEEDARGAQKDKWWDEVSLVNYHSLSHFAGMAASEQYQHINRSYRLPSLDDTTIICTQEVDLESLRARVQPQQRQANL